MSNRLDATNCTHEVALARVAELESKLDVALGLLRDVATSGVEFEDSRVSYVTVQIDSDTWAKLQQYGVVEKQTSDPFVESAKQRCSHCGNYVPCGCWPTV